MSLRQKILLAVGCAWIGFLLLTDATPDLMRVVLLSDRFAQQAEGVIERDEIEGPKPTLAGYPSEEGKYRRVEYVFQIDGRQVRGDWMTVRSQRARSLQAPTARLARGARTPVCYSRVMPGINALTCDSGGNGAPFMLFLYWFVAAALFFVPLQVIFVLYRKHRKEGRK